MSATTDMDDSTKTHGSGVNTTFYVKGVEQLENSPEYTQWTKDEFPHRRSIPDISRRDMLKLIGGTAALAGMSAGCRFLPEQKIVPFVVQPEDQATGVPRFFASTYTLSGYGMGVVVESHEGRPTNIAGNPKHPASLGAASHFAIGSLLNLYDPDRLKNPQAMGDPTNWADFLASIRKAAAEGGLAILTETVGSPALAQVLQGLVDDQGASWYQYEPVNRDNLREGAIKAFGRDVHAIPHFDKADVVLSLDHDFMLYGMAPVRFARDLAGGRNIEKTGTMNRVYSVDSYPTLTGAMADHKIALKPSQVVQLAMAVASLLGVEGVMDPGLPSEAPAAWVGGLVKDLQSARGRALVTIGEHYGPDAHALVFAINQALGSFGSTLTLTDPVLPNPVNQLNDIKTLVDDLNGGRVKALLILGGNPAYTAPADLKFEEAIKKAPFSACLASHMHETAEACQWALPESHMLEGWGDAVAFDGTVSVVQPLVEPLYDSKSAIEVADAVAGKSRPGLEVVAAYWRANQARMTALAEAKSGLTIPGPAPAAAPAAGTAGQAPAPAPAAQPTVESAFDRAWRIALSEGVIVKGAPKPVSPALVAGFASTLRAPASQGLELLFLPDPTIYDGRYANNNWLQEMPKSLSNFTWDNAYFLSPATSERLGLERKTFLGSQEIENPALGLGRPKAAGTLGSATVIAAAASQIGQADDLVVFHLGYGRTKGGEWVREADVYHGGGFNAFALRTTASLWTASGFDLKRADGFYAMANVQFHNALESTYFDSDRRIIREATLEAFNSGEALYKPKKFHVPGEKHDEEHKEGEAHKEVKPGGMGGADPYAVPNMYNRKEHDHSAEHYQWAMTIDLNLCTGCGACVMACQSENNIPTVGKREVQKGREMHWIRIDRYYMGENQTLDLKNPPTRFQPLACVHCEQAPCEPVCPVAATVHSHEGLNQMVYNRCVGTRYCSNNCPYKVRRFNFLHYTLKNDQIPVLQMLNNPDVTVRGRGVMEKCTYCVQRINKTRIKAKREEREIADGEVVTACQAACPTQAIVFGDMRKPENAVAKTRASRRSYLLLEEANTVPRTTYLMRINNPNPEIEATNG